MNKDQNQFTQLRWILQTGCLFLSGIIIVSCATVPVGDDLKPVTKVEENMTAPPIAKRSAKDVTVHNDQRTDYYYWLRERENPDVIEYLKAENAYTEAMMKHTGELQDSLYKEMRGRIKETDLSVPVKIDDYYYYTRTEEGQPYPIHCRKKGSLEADEEILLDQNIQAEGYDFYGVGIFAVSPDHRLLAVGVDTTGAEELAVTFKNLTTGKWLDDRLEGVSYSFEWANDNKTVFYTTMDAARRPDKAHRHRLGNVQAEDSLVFHEDDDAYFLDVRKSTSKQYLFLVSESNITTEVQYLDANNPDGEFQIVEPRNVGHEYSVYHHGKDFYIVSNDEALNFKIMKTPVSAPTRVNWETIIPHRDSVFIQYLDMFQGKMVIHERDQGLEMLRIMDLESGESHTVDFPDPVYSLGGGENPDFSADFVRFSYSSMITPGTVYDYHFDTKKLELKKRDEVLGGYDMSQYETVRWYADAEDGTRIPMSILYKKGMEQDGQNPVYLYGYGSYGSTIDPYFNSNRFSLVDRGYIYVIAHIRGGGYMGRQWYENGKWFHKKNTFTDFIDCAEFLIEEDYTNPDRLAIAGGSAGGLLIGAVINMRPDLFQAAVASVPFVDVINTMLDETIPLTVIEYDEWGNPHKPDYYEYMRSYSPYDNVTAQDYPNLLVTAGLNDPRVQYWEPAKWTAKLRLWKTEDNVLILKTNMGAGHSGASGRYEYLKEVAFRYVFVLDEVGTRE